MAEEICFARRRAAFLRVQRLPFAGDAGNGGVAIKCARMYNLASAIVVTRVERRLK